MKKLLTLGLLLAGCSKDSPSSSYEMPPVPVKTASVEVRDVPIFFESIGTIQPIQTAEVRPQVSGQITAVHFTEGSWVEEGTPLYSIDTSHYAIKVKEAEALLAQNIAHLKNAEKKLERCKSLTSKDIIAEVEWDEMETQILLYSALVQAGESHLAAAKLDLENCQIYAPIAGRTGKTQLHVGSIAGGTPLVNILKTDLLYAEFSITEQELSKLPSSSPDVEVYAAGGDELMATGKVTFLDPSIDKRSGMIDVRALLQPSHKPVYPGQSVRVHIFTGKKEGAQLIPLRAIKTNQAGPYVFSVNEDNTVETRSVKLGAEQSGFIVVEEGLEGATKVVTEGHLRLFPGSKIEES